MLHKYFKTKQEAWIFVNKISKDYSVLDVSYKTTGINARTGENIIEWVVDYEEPNFNDLYPSSPIEL